MAKKADGERLEIAGQEVQVTSPGKIYFPAARITKLDVVRYYLAVGEGALRGVRDRPMVLKRYVHGIEGEFFFQKRAPAKRPVWMTTVRLRFPSGRTADEIVVNDLAQLVWIVNLGCIDLNPHPVRSNDLEHPDELRVDLDPGPGVRWEAVREAALVVRRVLDDFGLVGWPKTSGSRGIHVNVRIEPRWSFSEVRRAALALARDAERRAPDLITSKWWKEERHGVFVDYNQNAKDRTVASAYSVRPTPEARVSTPVTWDEVPTCNLEHFTLRTIPARFAAIGDLTAGMDEAAGSLEPLLELAAKHEEAGLADAPWPPHYRKQSGEPPRVQPSKRKQMPVITVAKAAKKEDALEGLGRWRERHPEAAAQVREEDVLVDTMRGRYTTWTRIRVNLRNVPKEERPATEPPDPDYDPWEKMPSSS